MGIWIEAVLSAGWAGEQYGLELHAEHLFVSVVLFILAYAVSQWLYIRYSAKAKDYGVLLALWTLRFALITMFVLSYEWPWRKLIELSFSHQATMWLVIAGLLVISFWLAHITNRLRIVVSVTIFCILSMIFVVLSNSPEHATYLQVIYNIALVGTGIWLIIHGINDGISHYFFLGVAVILLVAFMRYVDLIGEYIGGSILFLVLAALLFGAARYWKIQKARSMVRD